MADWSAKLKLPYMAAAQAQKHVTHNEALALLDAIVQLSVVGFDADTPPAVVVDGAVYALGVAPTGAWAGQGGTLALGANGGWQFVVPQTGWRAALGVETRVWDGAAWVAPPLPELQNLPGLGIGTSSSVGNPLAVAGEATLLTHAGAGHQLKINKAAAGDTASLLFQTGWSGRAEMGTAGNDDFAIKVSPDGSQWFTALTALASDGSLRPGGVISAQSGTAAAPGYSFDGDSDTGLFRIGANSLGVSVGGNQCARFHSGGLEVTGVVTGTAVQSTTSDITSGRLMTVGAFGLGDQSSPSCVNLDDFTMRTGFYRTSSSIPTMGTWPASAPTGFNQAGQLLVIRSDGGSLNQIWFSLGEDAVWRRRYTASAWGSWKRVTQMVGTVSQAGGTATGAIMERGSNANGDYLRFADGTQIVTRSGFALGAIATADGALFKAASDVSLTLAANFIAAPVVLGGQCSAPDVFVSPAAATVSIATLRPRCTVSKASGTTGSFIAIGRWF